MRQLNLVLAIAMVIFCFSLPKADAIIEFNDGETHNINYTIEDNVRVDYQTPDMQTTFNLLAGGDMPYPAALHGYYDSRINISGGTVGNSLYAHDSSQVTMSGGSVSSGGLYAYDNSQVTMTGGTVHGYLNACDNSKVRMSGGLVDSALLAYNSGQVTMSGGTLYHLGAYNSGQVTMSGGTVGVGLFAYNSSTITIAGSFSAPFGFFSGGELTGTLMDGTNFNADIYIFDDAQVILVPEPATLFLLSLGAVILRKRKK